LVAELAAAVTSSVSSRFNAFNIFGMSQVVSTNVHCTFILAMCAPAAPPARLYFLGYERKEDIPEDPVERVSRGLGFGVLDAKRLTAHACGRVVVLLLVKQSKVVVGMCMHSCLGSNCAELLCAFEPECPATLLLYCYHLVIYYVTNTCYNTPSSSRPPGPLDVWQACSAGANPQLGHRK
jgi:hypothetical protein